MSNTTNGGRAVQGCLPRHHLRACVLLLLAESSSHGYDLLEQARELGIRNIDAGGLYRELRSMEAEGLARSWWEESVLGPPRRTYVLTDAGQLALESARDDLENVHRLLTDLLGRYSALLSRVEG